eukprot:6175050-Pleurochrysis_carterae.AAC.2
MQRGIKCTANATISIFVCVQKSVEACRKGRRSRIEYRRRFLDSSHNDRKKLERNLVHEGGQEPEAQQARSLRALLGAGQFVVHYSAVRQPSGAIQ